MRSFARVDCFSFWKSWSYTLDAMSKLHALPLLTAAALLGTSATAQAAATPSADGLSARQQLPLLARSAAAQDQDAAASFEAGPAYTNADADASAAPKESAFRRWRPKGLMTEIGVFGGAFWLHKNHAFFGGVTDPNPARWRDYPKVLPEFGLRVGLYPVGAFGVELEGSLLPTQAKATGLTGKASALFFSARGHLVLQLPLANLVPFIAGGVGAWGVYSKDGSGEDVDLGIHFGGGLKYYATRYLAVRADVRDVLLDRRFTPDKNSLDTHNLEVLLGLSVTLGREKEVPPPPPPPPPPEPVDQDGDGINDDVDKCPMEAETFNQFQDEDGCPESDKDADGFWDRPEQDACPDEAGVEPDGCPIRDTDGDGVLDPEDHCVEEPETANGFQDEDGCPDEVPKEEVAKFSGSIKGIQFENGKSTIRPDSLPTLDSAIELFNKYPTLKVQISGHTDSSGRASSNQLLSEVRAEAVKTYMVSKGVDAARITTQGLGETQPIDTNRTRAGRANNRRIEFSITEP